MTKGLDAMQNVLETESKGKAEATRMKKKLEADVAELEMNLEHANATNLETTKAVKKYHTQIRDLLEQADKARRNAEQELSDVNESLSDATVTNQSIAAAKRKMDSEMQTLP